MKSIKLAGMILLLSLSAYAKSDVEETPFFTVFSVACASESIQVEGSLVTKFIPSGGGQVTSQTTEGQGTTAIGLDSGTQYHVQIYEFNQFSFDDVVLEKITYRQKIVLKGNGPNNDLELSYTVRFLWNGEDFDVVFEKINPECR